MTDLFQHPIPPSSTTPSPHGQPWAIAAGLLSSSLLIWAMISCGQPPSAWANSNLTALELRPGDRPNPSHELASRSLASRPRVRRSPGMRYIPPKRGSAPKVTGSNTTRNSCGPEDSGRLTPLAPLSHVGQTVSTHPTFVWFVPHFQSPSPQSPSPQSSSPQSSSLPISRLQRSNDQVQTAQTPSIEFRLFAANGARLYRAQMPSQPGLMGLTLPATLPPLAIAQRYRWQVVLRCPPPALNPNAVATANHLTPTQLTAGSLVAPAEMEVIEPPPDFAEHLATHLLPQQKIQVYAEAGLWFDAIAMAFKSDRPDQVFDLLESLATLEAQTNPARAAQLQQIIELEQSQSPPPPTRRFSR